MSARLEFFERVAGAFERAATAIETIAKACTFTGVPVRPGDIRRQAKREKLELALGHIEAALAQHRAEEAAGAYWLSVEPGRTRAAVIAELTTRVEYLRGELAKEAPEDKE